MIVIWRIAIRIETHSAAVEIAMAMIFSSKEVLMLWNGISFDRGWLPKKAELRRVPRDASQNGQARQPMPEL
jgi:hypothetical protein